MKNNKSVNSKYHRLNHGERMNILSKIYKGKSLSQISKDLNRSKSTIIREITRNLYFPIHPKTCSYCENKYKCLKCKGISQKRWLCPEFEPLLCERQKHFPFVCNGCPTQTRCNYAHCYYNCDDSYINAKFIRSNSRSNKYVTKYELEEINHIVSDGVKKGQSIHHIYETNNFLKAMISEVTVRRYLYQGLFDVKPVQLHRFKRYSKKYNYTTFSQYKSVIANKETRTFNDFLTFVKSNNIAKNYWEYDSIEGNKKSKFSILTITHAESWFQAGFKIRKHNPCDVNTIIKRLQKSFGQDYKQIFKVNIADNGNEFSYFDKIEIDTKTGEFLCKTFFTSPFKATDKPHCERSHEYFRYVIPKGINFDSLSQQQISNIFSNINSYIRKSLNEKSPYEVFVKRFGKKAADLLGIQQINPEDVNLSPSLIERIKK